MKIYAILEVMMAPIDLYRKMKPFLPVLVPLLFLPLLVLAVKMRQSIVPRASNNADSQTWIVKINPEIIAGIPNGQPVYLSTLLVDSNGQPVPIATSYEWHMSTTASPGTLEPNGNLATFIPLASGSADIIVKATNSMARFWDPRQSLHKQFLRPLRLIGNPALPGSRQTIFISRWGLKTLGNGFSPAGRIRERR
ncbi:hypothetical protein HY339_01150 [Candidatus Gottesmanbacteria bacterium]|nr:hypothetical protein [Candidatus Gottesmanbacteria bacterium]